MMLIIYVNEYEVCSRTVQEVRDFANKVKVDAYSFYQLVESLIAEDTPDQDLAVVLEVLLTYVLNDPLHHTEHLMTFLDPHYFSICKSMSQALLDDVIKQNEIIDMFGLKA